LHNILLHAKASKVEIRIEATGAHFQLSIQDDGIGIGTEQLERPATLHALRQRSEALDAELLIASQPGAGTRLMLTIPLERQRRRKPRTTG
jgi:signal transduction histidine kinase